MPVIYKITSPTGKVYIGQSWNFRNRIRFYKNNLCKRQVKIYNSLLKYGYDNHKVEIVHELPTDVSQSILDNYEILYWELYKNCYVEMLNIKEPGRGGKRSKESIEKQLKTRKINGYKHSQEVLNKISLSNKGKVRTPEMIDKMKEGLKGRKQSQESINKMIETKRQNNKPFTEEHRKRISEALKGKPRPYAKHLTTRPTKARKVIDTNTNKIFNTIKEAAEENNMTAFNLRNRLVGIVNNNTSLKFLDNA
jgi:group I intron endonuclease